ncbi:glycosyltransferase family 4 protein [Pontibacter sp. 13R65]|uniref:glycosyltransferase family 4 protein n=1 Tax=Pontibacter sp. 13R65 TaxID=3127458 RepID=UPI00301CC4EF
MKIAVVLPDSEPFSPVHGGALARWAFEVYSLIDYETYIFTIKSETLYRYDKIIKLPQFNSNLFNILGGNLKHHFKYNLYPFIITSYARLNNINVVHILNRPSHVMIVRKFFPQAKIILHMQNDHMSALPDHIFNKVVLQSNLIISCSTFIQNKIINRAGDQIQPKCKVVYNGANNNNFSLLDSKSKKHINIVFAGRLVKEKGVLELINAVIPLLKRDIKVKLFIVGSHDFGSYIETDYIRAIKEAASPYQGNVVFTGFLGHKELSALYSKATLFVCPSLWEEPFGMVIAEAMAKGLPVMGSDRGGIPEVMGGAGILINPDETDEFTDQIRRVIYDDNLLQALANASYERYISTFSWAVIASKFKTILRELV